MQVGNLGTGESLRRLWCGQVLGSLLRISVIFISDPPDVLEFSGTLECVPDGRELGMLGASALLDDCPGWIVSLANKVKLILVA